MLLPHRSAEGLGTGRGAGPKRTTVPKASVRWPKGGRGKERAGVTLSQDSLERVVVVAKLVDHGRWFDRLVRWLCRFIDFRVPVVGSHAITGCERGLSVHIAAVLRLLNIEVAGIPRLPRRANSAVLVAGGIVVGLAGWGWGGLVRVERSVGDFVRDWLVALLVPVRQRESRPSARKQQRDKKTHRGEYSSLWRGQHRGKFRPTQFPEIDCGC